MFKGILRSLLCGLLFSWGSCVGAKTITVSAQEPEFTVQLRGNISTGYNWELAEFNTDLISFEGKKISNDRSREPMHLMIAGTPHLESWKFRLVAPHLINHEITTAIVFVYRRPWEKDALPGQVASYTVKITP